MQNDLQQDFASTEALRRKHESSEPHLRYALIFGGSAIGLILFCLASSGILLHAFSRNHPMQSMAPFGIISASDLKPLEGFPAPHLEIDDGHAQTVALLAQQSQKLNSYGWIDRSRGVVRIPIGRAMDLILQRGLPTGTNGISQTYVSALQLIQEQSIKQ